jgi:exopolysaccharide production protein ExoZ
MDGKMPLIYVGWSLEFEMFFYLSVTLLMFRKRNMWNKLLLLFSVLVILGRSATIAHFMGNYIFFTDPLILEFIFGVLVAKLSSDRPISIAAAGAAAVAVLCLLLTEPSNRVIVAGIPAAALVFAAAQLSRMGAKLSSFEKILQTLGDASYSIYLVQIFIVSAACKLAVNLLPSIPLDVLIFVSTTATVLTGFVVYIVVEKPALAVCRRIAAAPLARSRAIPAPLSTTRQIDDDNATLRYRRNAFLPAAHSHDLNPSEQVFAKLKTLLRKAGERT